MSNKQLDSDNNPMIDENTLLFKNQNSETFVTEYQPLIHRIVNGEVVEYLIKYYQRVVSCKNAPPINSASLTAHRTVIATLCLDDLLRSMQLPKGQHINYFVDLTDLYWWIKSFGYDPPAKDLANFDIMFSEENRFDPLVLHLIIKMLQKLP